MSGEHPLPTRLTIHAWVPVFFQSVRLLAADEAAVEHTVLLTQHLLPGAEWCPGAIPGRLYFDGRLVPIRSAFEAGVLALLGSAESTDFIIRLFAEQVVRFVTSDEYLQFAERVEQEADETKYDVWVVWDAATFSRAVGKAQRLRRLTPEEARELLEQGRPVAEGMSATQVLHFTSGCRKAGLGVRVSPEFRWRLP